MLRINQTGHYYTKLDNKKKNQPFIKKLTCFLAITSELFTKFIVMKHHGKYYSKYLIFYNKFTIRDHITKIKKIIQY